MTRRRRQEPTGSRRASREFAFRTLFESERSGQPLETVFKRTAQAMREGGDDTLTPLTPEAVQFARQLAEGVDVNWDDVQAALQGTIRGWSFEQMSQTDLNVLRLAAFEMMFLNEAHPPVIESAVRIARKFGGDDSGRFVNGVLADLSRKLASDAAKPGHASEPVVQAVTGEEPASTSAETSAAPFSQVAEDLSEEGGTA